MDRKFSGQLDEYMRQAGLSLRRVASQSGIPHQTIFNWLKGSQPRWHAALPEDLHRLGATLNLTDSEITLLLRLAGCVSARSGLFEMQEVPMQSSFRIPKGWFVTGDAPDQYEIGVDPSVTYENRPCVTIKAGPEPAEFAALAQQIKAEAYRGKRLRFSAALRSADLENRAALFMRISGSNGKMLAFDNMRNRYISGTNDWAHHALVLDVAEEAEDIIFGVLSSLQGQVWMADVHLEAVDRSVPTTDLLDEIAPYFPVNLEFEE
ncbi:MAG: helix-turn-helix transcriptional regulator [Chloroflexota bacterium]